MFNILDFIDSPDIREYNRKTVFTPAEQVALIACSEGTTVGEKLAAWKELVNNYDDDEFKDESIDIWGFYQEDKSVRQLVFNTICSWEDALKATLQKENVIYVVHFLRHGRMDWYKKFCFNFKMAYYEMVKDRERYLEEHYDCAKYVGIIVERISLVKEDDYDLYYYDNKLRMINIMRGKVGDEKDCISWDYECCVHVPTPFKRGDLLKFQSTYGNARYGVLVDDLPSRLNYLGFWRMDMLTRLDVVVHSEVGDKFGWQENVEILNLRYCDEGELPENMEKLKIVSKLRKMGFQRSAILYKYFHNACCELKKYSKRELE